MKILKFKIIKHDRFKRLEQSEIILHSRIKDSGALTFEQLRKLRKILINEITDVDSRLRQIANTYKTITNKNKSK